MIVVGLGLRGVRSVDRRFARMGPRIRSQRASADRHWVRGRLQPRARGQGPGPPPPPPCGSSFWERIPNSGRSWSQGLVWCSCRTDWWELLAGMGWSAADSRWSLLWVYSPSRPRRQGRAERSSSHGSAVVVVVLVLGPGLLSQPVFFVRCCLGHRVAVWFATWELGLLLRLQRR